MMKSPACPAETEIDAWTRHLASDGYCIIPDALAPSAIAALDRDLDPIFTNTPFCQGGFYGERTKRFGALLRRSGHAAALVQAPLILGIVEKMLGGWCDTIQLNLSQAIEIHPGALSQFPHRDEDMWQGEKGRHEYLVNVIWPLTSFTQANGATLIHSRSHGPRTADENGSLEPAIVAECDPGAAILFLGSTLHGAGANRTDHVRRAVIVSYCLGWLKPYENQWLAYPPAIARTFSPDLAALIGYRQHRPNLGNYEGRCPSILLGETVPEHIGAIDALRPDQEAMLADHVAAQRDASGRPAAAG